MLRRRLCQRRRPQINQKEEGFKAFTELTKKASEDSNNIYNSNSNNYSKKSR